MEHQTIELVFGDRNADGCFDIRCALPNGEARRTTFTPPFNHATFMGDPGLDQPELGQVRAFGKQLFEALFTASLEGDLRNTFNHLGEEEMLRIDLCFDPRDPEHQALSSLPWELMYWEQPGKHLVMNKKVLLNRHLMVQEPKKAPKILRRLRILAVIANPRDAAVTHFDADAFRKCLQDNLAAACDLEFLEVPTFSNLTDRLETKSYDVLHITGHGGRSGEDWGMCFETATGALDFVSAQHMRNMLDDYPDLKFINLVSCNLSRGDTPQGLEALAGVAHSLVNQGIPAVAAMQFPIAIDHALTYMNAFYARLIETFSLEAALDRARRRLYDCNRGGMAFASPVLYFRGKGSCLWEAERPVEVFLNTKVRNLERNSYEGQELLDFADFFEAKDDQETNHQIRNPADWQTLHARINRFKNRGWEDRPLVFRGNAWLPFWFALGFSFRSPGRFNLTVEQYNRHSERLELWRPREGQAALGIESEWLGTFLGGEVIVSINVSSTTPHEEVLKYRAEQPELRYLPMLKLSLPAPSRGAIKDEVEAVGYAKAFSNQIRHLVAPERIHLFAAMPQGLAFLIAHELAVSGEYVVYAHQNNGYMPAFRLR